MAYLVRLKPKPNNVFGRTAYEVSASRDGLANEYFSADAV